MPPSTQTAAPLVVIGAGLAGLSAAEALLESVPGPVCVIESTARAGGVLGTLRRDGWLVERSADCFLASRPEGLALVGRLGLTDRLLPVEPAARRALVYWDGAAVPVPRGFRLLAPGDVDAIRETPLLSPAGKARVLAEPAVPARDAADGDESLESFAVRRLGREAFERLVQPLVAGIWTADPARLSMAAACPEFVRMERDHGSLTAGERARIAAAASAVADAAAGARYGQFVTLDGGLATLGTALKRRLVAGGVGWRQGTVTAVTAAGREYAVAIGDGGRDRLFARGVVVACPAPAASRILAGFDAALATELAAIEYAGSAVVCLGFDRRSIGHALDAAGIVVPRIAGRRCLAISFASSKFPGRAPEDGALLRVFLGGALDPDVNALDDDALIARALEEVRAIVTVSAPPRLVDVARWQGAMPQYHLGHPQRVARIAALADRHRGFALAGAAYEGVGIPQVIASGRSAGFAVAAMASR